MSSDEKSDTKLPIQNLILLTSAVLGAVWLYEGPLKSSRPVDELSSQRFEGVGDRRVQARMWQDPFDAVARHLEVEKQDHASQHPHSLQGVVEEVVRADTASITVLALMVDGAPYADSAESRLRQRYAVLAGLERSGFEPVDAEHIRFFEWPDEPASDGSSPSDQPHACVGRATAASLLQDWRASRVPVEWYESSGGDPAQVLVLWIKDQDLGECPLASLDMMSRILSNTFKSKDHRREIAFKVIGPRFSGTLAAMVSEATLPKRNGGYDALAFRSMDTRLEVHSPWSTAPEAWIDGGEKTGSRKVNIADILSRGGVLFQRAIPTDDGLMQELVTELGRRGVELSRPCPQDSRCDHVALISEWDTLYGRALPDEFKEAAREAKKELRRSHDAPMFEEELDRQIRRFSYLRGLDGELPKSKKKNGSGESSHGDQTPLLSINERRKLAEQLERPEGRSQLDYVRRLVQVLKEAEAETQASCDFLTRGTCPGFRAIGVLGSDVYDKLLILQALKPNFPHAIFFTTDLDARLFHPREIPWTRNLVVASHFGLTLNKELQQSIPPFRDTYQTAVFYATMRALGVFTLGSPCSADTAVRFVERQNSALRSRATVTCLNRSPQPRLHEIGERDPVDLSIERVSSPRTGHIATIHNPRPQPPSVEDARWGMVYVIAVFVVGWGLLIPASQTVYGRTRSAYNRLLMNSALRTRVLILFGAVSCLLWFAVAPMIVADQEAGEPFSLYDGVSIWPSQLLRGVVIFLAILFIVRIRARMHSVSEEVEHSFHHLLAPRAQVRETRVPMVTGTELNARETSLVQWYWGEVPWSIHSWSLADISATPAAVWGEYQRLLTPVYLWGRVLGLSVVFFILGQCILVAYGQPIVPYRGNVVWYVNLGLLLTAVWLTNIVIFLVLDVTRMTSAFVHKLVNKELSCASPAECLSKLQLVARLTARIDILVYYPTVLIGLMLLARSKFLDNWHFPIGLALVVGMGAAYVVASAIRLRTASEGARRQVMSELAERRLADLASDSSQQIDQVMATIRTLKEGAFVPYAELPVFRAIALPSGAYGLFAALDLIANNF